MAKEVKNQTSAKTDETPANENTQTEIQKPVETDVKDEKTDELPNPAETENKQDKIEDESPETLQSKVIVVLQRFRDKTDHKTLFTVGQELEFDVERANDVVARGLAKFKEGNE
jgi:hypothetical protein